MHSDEELETPLLESNEEFFLDIPQAAYFDIHAHSLVHSVFLFCPSLSMGQHVTHADKVVPMTNFDYKGK